MFRGCTGLGGSDRLLITMKQLWFIWLLCSILDVWAQPARVILFRHAEKPDDRDDPHLSATGREHAKQLAKWLGEGNMLGTNGVALYAQRPTEHLHSIRCLETLKPLAKKLKLTISTPRPAADYKKLVENLLGDTSLKGQTAVVCWVHYYLPEFATKLGVHPPPPKWKGDDYHSTYVITLTNGTATLRLETQKFKAE